jgi:membrane-bound lytic murein transglycosylase MltF
MAAEEVQKFTGLVEIFKKYGKMYDFDYLMVAAQGYQESQLDQSKRSPKGAVGVMQLLPATAAAKPISILGIDKDADLNIKAGTLYMKFLREQYVNEPGIDSKNQLLMSLAAYNAGPGNLASFRKIVKDSGLNPDIWFNNVEYGASRNVGDRRSNTSATSISITSPTN